MERGGLNHIAQQPVKCLVRKQNLCFEFYYKHAINIQYVTDRLHTPVQTNIIHVRSCFIFDLDQFSKEEWNKISRLISKLSSV